MPSLIHLVEVGYYPSCWCQKLSILLLLESISISLCLLRLLRSSFLALSCTQASSRRCALHFLAPSCAQASLQHFVLHFLAPACAQASLQHCALCFHIVRRSAFPYSTSSHHHVLHLISSLHPPFAHFSFNSFWLPGFIGLFLVCSLLLHLLLDASISAACPPHSTFSRTFWCLASFGVKFVRPVLLTPSVLWRRICPPIIFDALRPLASNFLPIASLALLAVLH